MGEILEFEARCVFFLGVRGSFFLKSQKVLKVILKSLKVSESCVYTEKSTGQAG